MNSASSRCSDWILANFRRTRRSDSPTLAWSSLQHLLENAIPHVLIILDCCFAANAARDTAEGSTKEILAACGRENPTTGVGLRSFTSALIEELHAFRSNPFTVAMLHSRLVTMRWRLQFTPIYALLSEHGGNSIHLAPLPIPKVLEPHASLQGHGDYALGDDPMDLSSVDESLFSASAQHSSQSSVSAESETRVLLAVSIQHDATHDVSQWVTWLTTQAPWDVTKVEVKVEGAYESHSTLVLVSIPTYAWDGLPDKEAYRFIDFIRSSNLQQPRKSSRLASKALSATNKEHKFYPPISVSRYGLTKASNYRQRSRQSHYKSATKLRSHGKDETAVMKADTERDLDSSGATTANLAGLSTNVEADERGYDALAYPKPNETLDSSQTPISSSIADIAGRNSKPLQSKPRSAKQSNLWIAKSRPSRRITNLSADRPIAEGDAQSRNCRSQPYPRSSTSATTKGNRCSGPWSARDDEQLRQARQRGMSWVPIAREFFPTKSANACRKRHERLMDTLANSEDLAPPDSKVMEVDDAEEFWDDSGIGIDRDQEQHLVSYSRHPTPLSPSNKTYPEAHYLSSDLLDGYKDSPRKGTSRAHDTVDGVAPYTPPPSNRSSNTRRRPRKHIELLEK
jgi:hypothetical protein